MKTCTVCNRVLPNDSFPADRRVRTQLSSWCVECYRVKRAEWKAANPFNGKAHKEEERRTPPDALHWAGVHCRHISSYVTRVVTRFEAKHGIEAPPQLLAIRQLADQMALETPLRPSTRQRGYGKIACRNCGREFRPNPRGHGRDSYCSSYCRERFRQLIPVFESAGQDADSPQERPQDTPRK